jgi:hypothetical protein
MDNAKGICEIEGGVVYLKGLEFLKGTKSWKKEVFGFSCMNQNHVVVVRIPSLSCINEEVEGNIARKDSQVKVEYKEKDESCKGHHYYLYP